MVASDGTTGFGEIADIPDPSSAPAASAIESEPGECLIGDDPLRVNSLTRETTRGVSSSGFDTGSPFHQLTLGGIDIAVHDLAGKLLELPVYQLLGGRTRAQIPITWVIYTRHSDTELSELEQEVNEKVQEGFSAFKFKVGELYPELDAQRIETVRETAGDDAVVLLDAQVRLRRECY